MKTKQAQPINLIEGGRKRLENTSEFKRKVEEIKKELTGKYSLAILKEKNWIKRLFIKIKLQVEIRKRIEALSSLKNLHIVSHYQF